MKYYMFIVFSILLILLETCNNATEPDNIKPNIYRHYPDAFFIVSDTVGIYYEVNDNIKISNVELFVDGNATGIKKSERPYKLILKTDNYSNGSLHSFTIKAFDKSNNMQESGSVPFLVQKKRLVFNSDQDSAGIKIMNADGTNINYLTLGLNASFSPDGTKIVYFNQGLQIYNLNNGLITYLNNTFGALPFGIFTPDGSKIISSSLDGTDIEIYAYDVDGSNFTNLTNNSESDNLPDVSSDNTKITYCSGYDNNTRNIFIMNIDGTGKQQLTYYNLDNSRPQFSPDGTKILFFSRKQYYHHDDLVIMNSDGSNMISLADSNGLGCWSSFLGEPFGNAQFSPDGNRIVFSASGNIYLINIDGSNLIQLTNSGDIYSPRFSPDGSTIICQTTNVAQISHLLLLNIYGYPPDTLLSENSDGFFAAFEP